MSGLEPLLLGAGASGAGLFGVGGSFSLLSTASTLGTGLSALSSIQAGRAESAALKSQEAQTRLELQAEKTQAAQEAEDRARALRRTLATQSAIFAARGVSGTTGSAGVIQDQTIEDVGRLQQRADTLSSANQAILNTQAQGFSRASSAARIGGFMKAGKTLLGGFESFTNRGSVPSGNSSTGLPTPRPKGLR